MGLYKDLLAYKKAYNLSMEIYHLAIKFPSFEKYALTSQIIRSSRSVSSNIAEGYRKRIYKPHFIAKLSDAEMENTETEVWIDYALSCNYIQEHLHEELIRQNDEIGKLLHHMKQNPEKFQ
jgi:four helix bundle protein